MTWLITEYHPVSLFSLRPAHATASGGQTLLIPTAFAIKMALLNASIQMAGLEEGKRRFPILQKLHIAIAPPEMITVLKSFAKVQRPAEFKGKADERGAWIAEQSEKKHYPFAPTITYRELVQFGDPLETPLLNAVRVACTTPTGEVPTWLGSVLMAINYIGKRGGFLQPLGHPMGAEVLDKSFTEITQDSTIFDMHGTLQMLDDCGESMTFEHADIYSSKRITLGKERILRHVVLPYRLARSSRGYSLYRRDPD